MWSVVVGQRSPWLRAEYLALFAAALWLYAQQERSGLVFVLAFLIPDASLVANVVSRRVGATAYNVAHSYVFALGIGLVGLYTADNLLLAVALAWTAHVSFDRVVGLPYPMTVPASVAAGDRMVG